MQKWLEPVYWDTKTLNPGPAEPGYALLLQTV